MFITALTAIRVWVSTTIILLILIVIGAAIPLGVMAMVMASALDITQAITQDGTMD